jgi:hypothetical protein
MTIYYVRKSGNDGNLGTSPAQAWLTIDNAANNVAAGDTVYIGAGVYRETVTIDTDGAAGSEIKWYGDIDGKWTGDAGLVVVTVNADETGTGGTGDVLNLNGKKWNEFYHIVFGPGGSDGTDYTVDATAANCNYEGTVFDGCVFLPPHDSGNPTIDINYKVPGAISGNKPKIINSFIIGQVDVVYEAMAAGDVACGWVFENNVILSSVYGIYFNGPASSTNGISGYVVNNNVILGGTYCVNVDDQFNAGATGQLCNNLFLRVPDGVRYYVAVDGGTWTVSDNQGFGETADAGVTAKIGGLLGFMVDNIFQRFYGWNPYRAFEPVWDRNVGLFKSAMVDLGSATYAPATDIYYEHRPMCRGDDVGAGEARARAQDETGTVHAGSHSAKLAGAGYHDMILPCSAAAHTVTCYARYDSNYAGAVLPSLHILDVWGGTDTSDVMTAAADTWEQLSCNFTPTVAGFVRVRLMSQDASANGECYFDDVVVT